jgi:hypothetical protein
MYETALCNTTNENFELVSKEEWKYGDIQRFSTCQDIKDEIIRMIGITNEL